jgi:2-succinyl-5-enolpyruvyl-6-hydroxy-3-cyclohexene-1-carboxylate synthase
MNYNSSYQLIDQLVSQGVTHFCIAPGSRSTPLALALAHHPKCQATVHFDERGIAFFALGMAKVSLQPVCIITTSGTAVANLFPAVMEAAHDRIPLIILTADRPPELRDCGANQTCDQVKLFEGYTRWHVDLPCPDSLLPERYLATTIAQAVYMAKRTPQGAVHINCMFREPLSSPSFSLPTSLMPVQYEEVTRIPSQTTVENWSSLLSQHKRGVILAGALPAQHSVASLFSLAETLNWPVIADILFPLHEFRTHSHLIPYADPLLKTLPHLEFDCVLQFGDRIVSKTISQWLTSQSPPHYFHVSDHPMRQDPSHLITHRLECLPSLFCDAVLPSLIPSPDTAWLNSWREWNALVQEKFSSHFQEESRITEPSLIHAIFQTFTERCSLFLGNSMPIRDANLFSFSPHHQGTLYGNRGVSGIDGNIATIAGIAHASQLPTIGIIGDQTFLYDLNSLALVSKSEVPILLFVINNGGGGIFSFLPIAKQQKNLLDTFWAAAHDLSFQKAAELFDISYSHPSNALELHSLLNELKAAPCTTLIEVTTDREENVLIHEQLHQCLTCHV